MSPNTGVFVPPSPDEIPALLDRWCSDWRSEYNQLLGMDSEAKLDQICRAYYEFLRIHPFTDGNGRMGRLLLDQMLRELLSKSLSPSFSDARFEHQAALTEAGAGNFAPLRAVLEAALL